MKLIVGLGNPGAQYENTRHNVGFMLAEKIAASLNLEFEEQDKFHAQIAKNDHIIIVKPLTFMNSSGKAVKALMNYYKIAPSDLYVIHDDLDIKLGEYKIQLGVGPKVHYGINSIEEHIHQNNFWRVRVGVDARDPENRTPGEAYVLQRFTDSEELVLTPQLDLLVKNITP